jgi:hypothetical protein
MEAAMNKLMAIKVNERDERAPHFQEVLTKHGCIIKTRVGFHETDENNCSLDGIIILHLLGKDDEIQELYSDVKNLNGITPKFIEFQ